jgi:hypothetical protein
VVMLDAVREFCHSPDGNAIVPLLLLHGIRQTINGNSVASAQTVYMQGLGESHYPILVVNS